jgi:hypothetical protein
VGGRSEFALVSLRYVCASAGAGTEEREGWVRLER